MIEKHYRYLAHLLDDECNKRIVGLFTKYTSYSQWYSHLIYERPSDRSFISKIFMARLETKLLQSSHPLLNRIAF